LVRVDSMVGMGYINMPDSNLIINIFNQMQYEHSRMPIFVNETPNWNPSDMKNDFDNWASRQKGDMMADLHEFFSKRKTNQ
jgi:hypothetical protein